MRGTRILPLGLACGAALAGLAPEALAMDGGAPRPAPACGAPAELLPFPGSLRARVDDLLLEDGPRAIVTLEVEVRGALPGARVGATLCLSVDGLPSGVREVEVPASGVTQVAFSFGRFPPGSPAPAASYLVSAYPWVEVEGARAGAASAGGHASLVAPGGDLRRWGGGGDEAAIPVPPLPPGAGGEGGGGPPDTWGELETMPPEWGDPDAGGGELAGETGEAGGPMAGDPAGGGLEDPGDEGDLPLAPGGYLIAGVDGLRDGDHVWVLLATLDNLTEDLGPRVSYRFELDDTMGHPVVLEGTTGEVGPIEPGETLEVEARLDLSAVSLEARGELVAVTGRFVLEDPRSRPDDRSFPWVVELPDFGY